LLIKGELSNLLAISWPIIWHPPKVRKSQIYLALRQDLKPNVFPAFVELEPDMFTSIDDLPEDFLLDVDTEWNAEREMLHKATHTLFENANGRGMTEHDTWALLWKYVDEEFLGLAV